MNSLLIIGARGYGREVYGYAVQCSEYNREWTIKGFLDDNGGALDGYPGYPPVIGPVETYTIQPGDVFACALGDVSWKEHYVKIIRDRGGVFVPIIHPSVVMLPNSQFGEGFIACPWSVISCDVKIGDFVTVQSFCEVGHDVRVGNFCHINAYVFLGGFVSVGDFTTLHTGAKVLPRVRVGSHVTVGAGSVVTKKVKDSCTVFGSPARVIFEE